MLMKNKFSKFINLQGKYLTSLLILLTFAIGQMWGAPSTKTYNFDDGVALATDWDVATTVPSGGTAECLITNSLSGAGFSAQDGNYIGLAYKNKSGINITITTTASYENISNITFKAVAGDNSKPNFAAYIVTSDGDVEVFAAIGTKDGFATGGTNKWGSKSVDLATTKTGKLKIVTYASSSGKYAAIDDVVITYTPSGGGGGPVDPTLTYNDGAYTTGSSALDLNSLIASQNSDGDISYAIKTDPTGDAYIDNGHEFSSGLPGTVVITATQAATASYNAISVDFNVVVSEPVTPECPDGNIVTGWEELDQGQPIELTATLTSGNGDITYTWYKSATNDLDAAKAGGAIATGNVYSKAHCELGDEGFYFCVATKDACSDAVSNAFEIIAVHPMTACAELYPATSGASPTAKNEELLLQSVAPNASYGGKIYTAGAKDNNWSASFTYTANGLQLNKGGADSARVELNHLMQAGTVITATLVNPDANKARGYKLLNMAKTVKATWQATTTDPQTYTYTVVAGDGLEGTNKFLLNRAESSALKELKVSNCGAELFDLTSAVVPAGEATVNLSANKVIAGGSATASYTITDPTAYDFDEWVVSSGDATIADAHATTAAITMGSSAATITLKLKAAGVKHTVTYYDGAVELGTELVNAGGNPTGAGLAPRKLGYTFGGWSTTNGGTAATLSGITVSADLPLYAVWNAIDCAAQSGTIYTMSIAVAPAANCTIKTAEGYSATWDLYQYNGVSGGEAIIGNTGGSNNCILQTNKTILLKDENSYLKLDFDCPLKEGDKIRSNVTGSGKAAFISTEDTRPEESGALAIILNSTTGEIAVPAALDGATSIYIWKGGGNVTITSINIYRPAHFAVTFNMHDHGTAVTEQSVVEGGKVTKPADPTATGWDFGGWYKTYVADPESYSDPWDFDNDVVNAATELHAKWTAHVTSSDATLKDLTVNGVTVAGFDPATEVYNVVLEMGTSVVPTVAGDANDSHAKSVGVTAATSLPGATTILVTAEDNSTTKTYTINFSVATSKDIELVWDKSKVRCDDTKPDANVLIAAMSQYLSASYTGSAAEGNSLNTGKTTGSKIIITAKPGYAFKAMGFYGKIQDGTCNFYNDGVVETIGTSTDDACYADVFSNDEVHEFIIELTGTNGVYIRNMQLTIIEACTPVVLAWDAEPVEFEVGKAGYAIAATANNGGTIAYGSSDASIISVDAGNGVLSVSDLGSVTLSASTAEGDGTTFCENGGANIVLSKAVNTYYLVKFDGQNGEAADEVKFYAGDVEVALPASDPLFAGHTFAGWFDAATGGNAVTAAFTPAASMTLYAHWTTDCTAPTIVEHPESANYFTGRTADALECQATAAGGNALTYKWYSCDDDQKTNPQELSGAPTPSTAVAGTFYFFCAVTEEGCANVANSNVAVITVSDKDPICLAWVDVTGENTVSLDEDKSLYAPSVSAAKIKGNDTESGGYGGRIGWKFNSAPGYIAIEGAPFKSGDIVEMFVTTTTADKARVFNANEAIAANIIAEGAANMVQGANHVALTADANNLYLRRGDDFGGWNPYVAYVAVYRACTPILNKVTVAGVEGTPDNTNHVAIEVPFSTDDAALSAIAYDWVSNNDAWTADPTNAPVAANAWAWDTENTVTFTDKDGDESVYYVTISKAAPSTDATLSALTVNGQAVALVDGVFEYSVELPYGTTSAPTVAATANHVAATATVAAPTLSGASITVVPESGADDKQVYTLTFVISKWKEVVIWDGSYMTEVATSPDATTGFAWAVNGFSSITNYNATCGIKAYTKTLPSGGGASASRNVAFTVPAGYVAKFYIAFGTHSDGNNRGMFIGENATKTLDATSVLTLYSNSRTNLTDGTSEIVGAGTYYLNPMESVDFYEIRAYLRPGYARTAMLGNGVLGTICVDHNVAIADVQGASIYELVGKVEATGKIAFDEIVSGEMVAGVPYVFQAHGDKLVLFYGDTKVVDPVDLDNGMYGTFAQLVLKDDDLDGVYYFAQRALWSCAGAESLTIPANRAYVKLGELPDAPSASPAPGRRRVLFGVNGEQTATDIDNLNASEKPVKLMIDGQLFIIRGEKMFDATGRLVK